MQLRMASAFRAQSNGQRQSAWRGRVRRFAMPVAFLLVVCLHGGRRTSASEPSVVLCAEFKGDSAEAALAGWATSSSPHGQRWALERQAEQSILVCPALADGRWIELRSPEFAVRPWHRYCVKLRWRGGLFYQWSVGVAYELVEAEAEQSQEQRDGAPSEGDTPPREFYYALFPPREGLAPPPAWETRSFELIAPSNAAVGRLVLRVRSVGDRGHRPALEAVRIVDLGPAALPGDPPGPQAVEPISAERLAKRQGGRGYHKSDQHGRYLIDQGGTSLEGSGVVFASTWARGQGTLRLSARIYAPNKGRYFDFVSAEWKLLDGWHEYRWELPISFAHIRNLGVGIVADVQAEGAVELDEPTVKTLTAAPHDGASCGQ